MPTYQYSCTECGHFFEQFQSFSEESLTVCPACEGRLRKVFNAVGVVFKGSGFYRTDSRASNGAASGDGAPKESGATKGESGGKDGGTKKDGASTSTGASAPSKSAPAGTSTTTGSAA